jgi:hypothetical protein
LGYGLKAEYLTETLLGDKLAENSSAVAFHKFVILCNGRENDLFCFFEGRDSQYYCNRIKSITNRKYHPISCGNKKIVIDTYEWLNKQPIYNKYFKTFFVDRDFDPLQSKDNLYETPCYSIENFYVNEECLSEILKNEFGLTEVDSEFTQIIELFRSELANHNQATVLFNAWYATLKEKKAREKLKTTGVNLDDKLPKDFICLKIGSISSSYDLNKIKAYFTDAIEVTEEEVLVKQSELLFGSTADKLRGKFQLTFYFEFLRFLIEDANKNKKTIRRKTKFNVDKANIFTQLSQYAITPNCLVTYLKQYAA